VIHYDNKNRGYTRLSITKKKKKKKHYWVTQYIFQQIVPSSGDTIDFFICIESLNFFYLWYLTLLIPHSYYHNVSPRGYAKILWIDFIFITCHINKYYYSYLVFFKRCQEIVSTEPVLPFKSRAKEFQVRGLSN
jgi:hypothetical protein